MNFNDVLNTPVTDIEKPPLPPFGSYKMIVTKPPVLRQITGKDGTEYDVLDFICRGLEAGPDVDASALEAYGPVKNIVQTHTFMFNKSDETAFKTTLSRLRTFLEKHLNLPVEGIELKEALPKAVNAAFMANIQYDPDPRDASNMFARIKSTGPVE